MVRGGERATWKQGEHAVVTLRGGQEAMPRVDYALTMEEFEKRKKELMTPLLIEMGAALIDCQGFEYGVALLLLHLSRVGVEGLDPTEHIAIMDNQSKKTAGQLIAMLRKRVDVRGELEDALTDALDARNFLMHRAFIDNVERVPEPDSRAALVKEFGKLRARVRRADKLIRPFVEQFSRALDGVELEQLEAEVRAVMMGEAQPK